MSAFAPPPLCSGAHIAQPAPRVGGERFGRAHCARCGWSLEALLRRESVEIARRDVPLFWTSWRGTPRSDEVLHG